jgi:hypothetical protein
LAQSAFPPNTPTAAGEGGNTRALKDGGHCMFMTFSSREARQGLWEAGGRNGGKDPRPETAVGSQRGAGGEEERERGDISRRRETNEAKSKSEEQRRRRDRFKPWFWCWACTGHFWRGRRCRVTRCNPRCLQDDMVVCKAALHVELRARAGWPASFGRLPLRWLMTFPCSVPASPPKPNQPRDKPASSCPSMT